MACLSRLFQRFPQQALTGATVFSKGWIHGHVVYLIIASAFLGCTLLSCSSQRTNTSPAIAAIDSVLHAAIAEELVPGAVIIITQDGETLHEAAYGYGQLYAYGREPMATPHPMTLDHRFDLASLTKVFATTFGLMLLVDQEKIGLDTPLHSYLPDFRGSSKDSITVRHLLTHSAGLYPWKPIYYHARSPKQAYAYINQLPLAYPVGTKRLYSDLGFMLLGYLIETVSGQPLDVFLEHELYQPLGLQNTTFKPPPIGLPFAATSHGNPFEKRMVADDDFGYLCDEDPDAFQGWRDYVVVGEVNDGNAHYGHQGVAGHAGLFSTASDLDVLITLLLEKGVFEGQRLMSEAVIDTFLTKTVYGHGMGWAMANDVIPVDTLPEGSFGHTGFTGTYAVAFPAYDLSLILLSNRQNTGVDTTGRYTSVTPLRRKITTVLLSTVTEKMTVGRDSL